MNFMMTPTWQVLPLFASRRIKRSKADFENSRYRWSLSGILFQTNDFGMKP